MTSKAPYANCEVCPLRDRPYAPTSGPPDSDVIIVSRSPSYQDGMSGKPFSGPSGKVLDHLLKLNGVSRKDVRITNVVLCSPKDNDVPKLAIECCKPRLAHEAATAKLVIAAGSEAVKFFCKNMSIDRARGYVHEGSPAVVATNNPALVLREADNYPNLLKDFRRAFHPMPAPTFPTVKVVESYADAIATLGHLSTYNFVAADIESRGGLTHKATLISIQFAIEPGLAYVFGEREGLFTNPDFLRNSLQPFIESHVRDFCWHNGSFDTKVLRHTYGMKARIDEDTLLMSYALDERPGYHKLEYLLMEEFGWPKYEDTEINKIKKTGIVTNYDKFYQYAGWDVAGTYQLAQYYAPMMEAEGVS